jgi:hypothetical protein
MIAIAIMIDMMITIVMLINIAVYSINFINVF